MADWEQWKAQAAEGTLSSEDNTLFTEAVRRGMVPGTEQYKEANQSILLDIARVDIDKTGDDYLDGLVGTYLKRKNMPMNGVGMFTSDPNGMSSRDIAKTIQNNIGVAEHEDTFTEFDKWVRMDREQKLKDIPTFTAERVAAEMENLVGVGLLGESQRDDVRLEWETQRRFTEDFTKYRTHLEKSVKTKLGRDYAKHLADGGAPDSNAFNSIQPSDREHVLALAEAMKVAKTPGFVSEVHARVASGVKDISLGAIQYVAEKGTVGLLSALENLGVTSAKSNLRAFREQLQLDKHEQDALRTKYAERGFVGKGWMGVVDSLPLMVSFYINGPSSVARSSRVGAIFNRLMTKMPVALATLSMARTHEQDMIERGVSPEDAAMIALPAQALNMYVEKASLDKVFGVGKDRIFSISNRYLLDKMALGGVNFFYRGGKAVGIEGLEELYQGLVDELTAQLGSGNIDERRLYQVTGETAKEVLPTLSYFALAGAGSGIVSDVSVSDLETAETLTKIMNQRYNETLYSNFDDVASEKDFNEVYDRWNSLTTKQEKVDFLRDINTVDIEKAMEVLEQESDIRKAVAKQAEAKIKGAGEIEQRYEELRTVMSKLGVEERIVTELTDNLDPQNVGQLIDDFIEVVDNAADPERVFNHEVFEWLDRTGAIDEGDWAVFSKALQNPEYANLKLRYADVQGMEQVKEVMADAWAQWSPEERGVVQKVFDYIRKMLGIVTEKDVFRKLDTYLKEAKAVEQKLREPQGTPVDIPKRFARGQRLSQLDATEALQIAAERYALAKVEGRDTAKIADRLGEELGRPADDITARGEQLYTESQGRLEAGADRLAQRLGVRTVAAEKARLVELRKARKEGVAIAKKAQKAKETAEKKRERIVRQTAEKLMPDDVERANVSSVFSGDLSIKEWVKSINDAAKSHLSSKGVEGQAGTDKVVKHEMFHQMWEHVRTMPYGNNLRSGMETRLHKILEDGTKMDTAEKLAQHVIDTVSRINTKSTLDEAKAEFNDLIKAEAGKPLRRKDTILKRTLSQEKHAELQIIKEVAQLDKTAVALSLSNVKNLLNSIANSGVEDVSEAMEDIEIAIPIIGSKRFASLPNTSKLNLLKNALENYGGVLEHGTAKKIREATESLVESILSDSFEVIKAADAMARKADDGKTLFKKVFGVRPNKLAKAVGGAGIFSLNIRQRLEQFARAGGKQEKAAVSKLMNILGIQKGNTEFDTLKREMHEKVDKIFNRVYGKGLSAMEFELTDTKQEWAKYNKLNSNALSKQQLIGILSSWYQQDFRPTMEEKMGYTPEMIAEIEQVVGKEGIALIAELRKFYAEYGDKIDEVSMKVHGVKVAIKDPTYMPGQRLGVPLYNAAEVKKTPVMPPSFDERQSSRRSMDVEIGVIQLLVDRIDETAHYISHAEGAVLAQEIFGDREIAKEVIDKHGDTLWKEFTDHLQDVMSGGNSFRNDEKILRRLSAVLATRGLSGNVTLAPKQLTSVTAPAFRYGLLGMIKEGYLGGRGAVDWLTSFRALKDSPQWKNRAWSGATELVEDSLRNEYGTSDIDELIAEGKTRNAIKTVNKALRRAYSLGMLPTRGGDIGAIALIGPTIYQAKLREHHGNADIAMAETWEVMQETQQSKAIKDRNRLIRRGGPAMKLLGMFMSTKGQYFAFVSRASHDFIANPNAENAGKLANALAVHALLDGAYSLTGLLVAWGLFGDEPDEEWRLEVTTDILAGYAGSKPIMGMLAEAGWERMLLGKSSWGGTDFPFESLKMDVENAVDIIKATADGDVSKMVEEFNEELSNWITIWRQTQQAVKREDKK